VSTHDAELHPQVRQEASASGFSRIFQSAGDMIIYEAEAPYRLSAWPSVTPEMSLAQVRHQPSQLLRASHAVVPFTGREAELRNLCAWRDDPNHPSLAVRLIHGPGGQGKSRLAGHAARAWAPEGWVVLQAHDRRDRSAPVQEVPRIADAAGVLLVIDYAERWTIGDLLSLLRDTAIDAEMPIRVLLLARPAGTWWQSLAYRIEREMSLGTDAMSLLPLEQQPSGRLRLFTEARDRFAALLEVSDPRAIEPPAALQHHNAYQIVLTVHMAALAAVLAHDDRTAAPSDPAGSSAFLLARERDRWQALHTGGERLLATDPDAMAQTVYTAILTGPLSHRDGLTALHKVCIESTQHPGRILKDHALCYPPSTPGSVLEPLYPDRLAEDFLALTIPGHGTAHPSDPWTLTATPHLLSLADGDDMPVWTHSALIVLIETARRWPHIGTELLYPLLRTRPQVILEAGGAALTALAELDGVDSALLEAIDSQLPTHRHVDLDVGIAALSSRLSQYRLAHIRDPAARAHIYEGLGVRLYYAGLRQDALAATEEAVALYRQLARDNPATLEPEYATSLNELAIQLSGLGRQEDALIAEEEAVALYRRLARDNPATFEDGLAGSVDNLSNWLFNVGRREEALAASEEAVAIYRRLAWQNANAFEPGLAASLSNLGSRLWGRGRREEALAVSEEAVALYRRLALGNRAALGPDLAGCLDNLGGRLLELGRPDEALASIEEAVALYRQLTAANPAGLAAELAASLSNLGNCRFALGQRGDALTAAEEGVALYRQLVAGNPAAFEPALITFLSNLGNWLAEAGRWQEALTTIEEAVIIGRRLAARNPGVRSYEFAVSLCNLGTRLWQVGRQEEALVTTAEGVVLLRCLTARNPASFDPVLVSSLSNLGSCQAALGQREKALMSTEEAVALCRQLASGNPVAFDPLLASALDNLGLRLSEAGRPNEGLMITEEAMVIRRRLVFSNPATFEPGLATSLSNRGIVLSNAGRKGEALATTEEAVALYRRLASDDPNAFEPGLAASLSNLGTRLLEMGRREQALAATEEAVALYRRLANTSPDHSRCDVI
jgi:tetratricopeptide (TPR) repeat protein